jgi:UDP-GlcNAc:undecaprenyl-phosphate/decaprenyl-phosphate GlcNAc-1-phosphate transferase
VFNNSLPFDPDFTMLTYALTFTLGFVLCAGLLWVLVRTPLIRYFADTPDHRKVHQWVVPRIGGLAIVASFLILVVATLSLKIAALADADPLFLGLLGFVGLFLLGAGTLDDVHPLNYKAKFLLQFLLAGVAVTVFGAKFDIVRLFGLTYSLGDIGALISIFWIVAMMNAVNIIDGVDGLAASVGMASLVGLGLVAGSNGAEDLVFVCCLMAGPMLGFLRFNFHRRHKVFLGDTGSQFLGAMLAILAMEVNGLPDMGYGLPATLLLVGYPLFDISVAMGRRFLRKGQRSLAARISRMFVADNDHLHHRLVYLGLSHVQTTFLLLIIASGFTAAGFAMTKLGLGGRIALMGYLVLACCFLLNRLGFIGRRAWLFVPRVKAMPGRIVGIIEPDDVFLHSLKSYQQDAFDFLPVPQRLAPFIGADLSAVVLHNSDPARFDEQWASLLRAEEFQEMPALVVAGEAEIERVKQMNKEGFRLIKFIPKPVQVQDLLRHLETVTTPSAKALRSPAREKTFSLAELAVRNRQARAQT